MHSMYSLTGSIEFFVVEAMDNASCVSQFALDSPLMSWKRLSGIQVCQPRNTSVLLIVVIGNLEVAMRHID